jgi:hypothetical protein
LRCDPGPAGEAMDVGRKSQCIPMINVF